MAISHRGSQSSRAAMNVSISHSLESASSGGGLELDSPSGAASRGSLELGIPITERLLQRIPGPRWALVAVWAGAVLVAPFVLEGSKGISAADADFDVVGELARQSVLAYVVTLLLVGVARLVDHARALRPVVEELTDG